MTDLAVLRVASRVQRVDHVHSRPSVAYLLAHDIGREMLAKTLPSALVALKRNPRPAFGVNQASRGERLQQAVPHGITTYRDVGILALSRMHALRRHDQLTAPSSRPGLLAGVGLG